MPVSDLMTGIEEALHHWLSTLAFTPALDIAWPAQVYKPVLGTPYLEPDFMPNKPEYGAIGVNAPERARGLYQILVHDAENQGSLIPARKADKLIEHFKPPLVIERNSIRVRMGSYDASSPLPWRGRAHSEAGWCTVPVSIPWWCDVF